MGPRSPTPSGVPSRTSRPRLSPVRQEEPAPARELPRRPSLSRQPEPTPKSRQPDPTPKSRQPAPRPRLTFPELPETPRQRQRPSIPEPAVAVPEEPTAPLTPLSRQPPSL